MNDDLKKKISEQEELISFLSKDNKLLQSVNDSLIKQNKLNFDIIENLHRRIDNFTDTIDSVYLSNNSNRSRKQTKQKLNDTNQSENDKLSSKNDNFPSGNDNPHSNIDNVNSKDDSNRSRDDSSHSKDDSSHSRDDSSRSRDESSHSKDESSHSRDDSNRSKDDSSRSMDVNSHSKDVSSHSNNESGYLNNESGHSNNESGHLNNERGYTSNERGYTSNERSNLNNERSQVRNVDNDSGKSEFNNHNDTIGSQNYILRKTKEKLILAETVQEREKRIIRGNIEKKFKKKFINKVKKRLTEEIYYFSSHEKVRVDALLKVIRISFPAVMRDFQLLRKYNWIEHVGPREGGHYRLTKEGRILTIEAEEYQ